jgi:hypothetical protein
MTKIWPEKRDSGTESGHLRYKVNASDGCDGGDRYQWQRAGLCDGEDRYGT